MLADDAKGVGLAVGAVLLRVGGVEGVECEVVVVGHRLARQVLRPRVDLNRQALPHTSSRKK